MSHSVIASDPFDYAQGGRRERSNLLSGWGLLRRRVHPEPAEGLLAMTLVLIEM